MRPAVIVNADDCGAGKGVRRLDHVVTVHRHVERSTRLRRSGEGDDEFGLKSPGDFCGPVVPYGIARNVDGVALGPAPDEEADDVA